MATQLRAGIWTGSALCLFVALGQAQTSPAVPNPDHKAAVMTNHASGPFEVKLAPQGEEDKVEGVTLGRMSLDKQYHGGLEAGSKGQMLTAGTGVKGSAGYVAIERVSGTLAGRSGSFVLLHSGTMAQGAFEQSIAVVPDSGTGQLVGLTGKMTVTITGGKHFYDFEYTLAETP